ncbi:MAG TPA: hydroxymethylglutaryl-CoA lyase [Chloroflexota bacterium]|nr:hydroxymethylglutaryl-CoA lyase [Chloroflexota bacterium]
MNAPAVVRLSGLPDRVHIYEVAPRDGLQNEVVIIPTEIKVAFIRRLVDAGLQAVELTSFVSPRWIPQFSDAEELLQLLGRLPGRHPVLVPNERGLDRALAAGVQEVAVFGSATESFSQRNLNQSVAASLEMFALVAKRARTEGLAVRGYISMCFGDPWEGEVSVNRAADVILAFADLGCAELSIGDTIGVATPGQVVALLEQLFRRGVVADQLAVHFHDTYGQALANTLIALQYGVTTVDSAAGGLGGCPYARSATGNLSTEDLVWQLHGLGIDTGIDLSALCATSAWMARILGRPTSSRVLSAFTSKSVGSEQGDE